MKKTGRKTQKALNFDFDTKKLEEYLGSKTAGYYLIRQTLKNLGFDWRQGSGYVSREKLSVGDINEVVKRLYEKHPWIPDCTHEFDVTDIANQHSLKGQFEYNQMVAEERMKNDPVYAMKIKAERKRENANADGVTAQFSADRARSERSRSLRENDGNER